MAVLFLKLRVSCDKINMYSVYGIINVLFERDKSVDVFSSYGEVLLSFSPKSGIFDVER